jgi:geranylgeranyl pyrophosphate synthase
MDELNEIYTPVKEGLSRVENNFKLLVEEKKGSFPELHRMLAHVLAGGKAVRPALTFLAGRCFEYSLDRLLPMATASELLHIATLVHDDAIDKADTRRNRQTVNKLWGLEKAVLFGDFLFARAGEFAAATDNITVVRLFSGTLQVISGGELRQSFGAFSLDQSFDKYLERIGGKTASLMSMATESGAILSEASEEEVRALEKYGYNLGLAFQIVDDILDFTGDEKEMGKPVGSDLTQGTVTLPSLLLLKYHPNDSPLREIFESEDKQACVKQVVAMVLDSTIIDECYKIAEDYKNRACHELDGLPDSIGRKCLIRLADYVLERNR